MIERQVITFPLDALDPMDPLAGLKRAKRIASHISFFKAGVCLGKTLVCVVKSSPLSSTIKTLEPIDQQVRGRAKPTFKKLLQGGNDTLRVFKARIVAYSQGYPGLTCCPGVLHPATIELNTLLEDEVMCRMHEWLRDCRSRDVGYSGPARPR